MGSYCDGDYIGPVGVTNISSNTDFQESNFFQNHPYRTSVCPHSTKGLTKEGRWKIIKKEIHGCLESLFYLIPLGLGCINKGPRLKDVGWSVSSALLPLLTATTDQ